MMTTAVPPIAVTIPNTVLAERYDAIPYAAIPHPSTHPDRLATVAAFLGMDPPAVGRCRVLEVGCSDGANLIPMALGLPESRFVGCDLSQRALDAARGLARMIGEGGGKAQHDSDEAVRTEFRAIAQRTDSALFHDDLALPNDPVYFHEFVAHAVEQFARLGLLLA